jgi:hypothetical protein
MKFLVLLSFHIPMLCENAFMRITAKRVKAVATRCGEYRNFSEETFFHGVRDGMKKGGAMTSRSRAGDSFWAEEQAAGNVGLALMSRMGWNQGSGLGRDGNGQVKAVSIKRKRDNAGIGAEKMQKEKDEVWKAATDVFNGVLGKLQSIGGGTKPKTSDDEEEEERNEESAALAVKRLSARAGLYSRFMKARDVSRYSQNDLSAILVRKRVSADPDDGEEEEERKPSAMSQQDIYDSMQGYGVSGRFGLGFGKQSNDDNNSANSSVGLGFFSRQSSAEAQKESTSNVQANSSDSSDESSSEESSDDEVAKRRQNFKEVKSLKQKHNKDESSDSESSSEESSDDEVAKRRQNTKKVKNLKQKKEESSDSDSSDGSSDSDDEKQKKTKTKKISKKQIKAESSDSDDDSSDSDVEKAKKVKKSKKSKKVVEEKSKADKKQKKRKREESSSSESSSSESEDESVKRKAKKAKRS